MMILTPFSRYPEFLFISDNEASKLAGLDHRHSEASLHGIISDIELLSESDFVVCTFSSQVPLNFSFYHLCFMFQFISIPRRVIT